MKKKHKIVAVALALLFLATLSLSTFALENTSTDVYEEDSAAIQTEALTDTDVEYFSDLIEPESLEAENPTEASPPLGESSGLSFAEQEAEDADVEQAEDTNQPVAPTLAPSHPQTDELPGSLQQEPVPQAAILNGYVSAATVENIIDGSAPYDNDNEPGNDSSSSNGIVRTFDTIAYELSYTTALLNEDAGALANANMQIEFILDVPSSVAYFDTDAMPWLLDASVTEQDGIQTLTGYRAIPQIAGVAVPGAGTLNVVVQVYQASHGDVIRPTFSLKLEGSTADLTKKVQPAAVSVSAAPRYNVVLQRNTKLQRRDTYNFTTGLPATTTDAATDDIVNGRMYAFVVTLQLYNESIEKGLMGIEIPKDEIEVTLELTLEKQESGQQRVDITSEWMPRLWDYTEYAGSLGQTDTGVMGRLLKFDGMGSYASTDNIAPGEVGDSNCNYKNNVGVWQAEQANTEIVLTVAGFAFDTWDFPTARLAEALSLSYMENIGCFTGTIYQVLVPLPQETNTATDYYLTTKVKSYSATTAGGIQVGMPDMLTTDNAVTNQVVLKPTGAFDTRLWVHGVNASGKRSAQKHLQHNTGDGWAYPGEVLELVAGIMVGSNNDTDMYVYGSNTLVAFDDRAFEIPAEYDGYSDAYANAGSSTLSYRTIYAAKPDGLGWRDEVEMYAAQIDDLIYFSSAAELAAAGYVCVGAVIEARGGYSAAGVNHHGTFRVRVKEEYNLVGDVYAMKVSAQIYTQGYIPGTGQTLVEGEIPGWAEYINHTYAKTVYDGSGSYTGHTGNYYAGQSLLVIRSLASINKSIAQKSGSASKVVYDLDAGQRQVDYKLTPNLAFADGKTADGYTNTVEIYDTLPAGLTYIEGSATLGGTYSTGDGYSGHVDGGVPLEPEMTSNSDGTTTLLWRLENVLVGAAMEPIYFSAVIGDLYNPAKDAANNQEFLNTVRIWASGDGRAARSSFSNLSSASLKVSRLASVAVTKLASTEYVELGEGFYYDIVVSNTSINPIEDFTLLDILPANNDGRGSSFSGKLVVERIELTTSYSGGLEEQLSLYTTNAAVQGSTAKTIDMSLFSELRPANSSNGELVFTVNSSPAALALQGLIPGNTAITVRVYVALQGSEPENVYANNATLWGSSGFADTVTSPVCYVQTIGRSISGMVWQDANRNGERDTGEAPIAGARVRLYDTEGNEVLRDIEGTAFGAVTTASDGSYCFDRLPEGSYTVVIEGTAGFVLAEYEATTLQKDGVDNAKNNDFTGSYNSSNELERLQSVALSFDPASSSPVQELSNIDAGVYLLEYTLSIEKTAAQIETGILLMPKTGTKTQPVEAGLGQRVEYRITLTVTGDERAKTGRLLVEDILPEGMEFVEFSSQNSSAHLQTQQHKDGRLTWELDSLPAGESLTLAFTAEFPYTTDLPETDEYETLQLLVNTASVTDAKTCDTAYSNSTYHALREPYVTATKAAGPASEIEGAVPVVEQGEMITYFISLENTGDAAAENFTLQDAIPEGTSYVEGSVSGHGHMTEDADGLPVLEWVIPSIPAGETHTVSFSVTVDTAEPALITNRAIYQDTVHKYAPDCYTNEVAHQVIGVYKSAAILGMEKAAPGMNAALQVYPGETILYTIGIEAPAGLTHVTIQDPLPQGLTLVGGSIRLDGEPVPDEAYSKDTHTISIQADTLEAGLTLLTFGATVDELAESIQRMDYSNTAEVTAYRSGEQYLTLLTNEVRHYALAPEQEEIPKEETPERPEPATPPAEPEEQPKQTAAMRNIPATGDVLPISQAGLIALAAAAGAALMVGLRRKRNT